MEFDANGNASPGIHKIEFSSFKAHFVDSFSSSTTRKRNLEGFVTFINNSFFRDNKKFISKIWIDGSFCTSKEEPNDIDGIIFINPNEDLNNCMELFHFFPGMQQFGKSLYCDFYMAIDSPLLIRPNTKSEDSYKEFYRQADMMYKYWMGQFCFDRDQNPKGIFEIKCEGSGYSELSLQV